MAEASSLAFAHNIQEHQTIGLYHNNPIVTPLEQCNYVAAVVVNEGEDIAKSSLPSFVIPAGLCARFDAEGEYGDVLGAHRVGIQCVAAAKWIRGDCHAIICSV